MRQTQYVNSLDTFYTLIYRVSNGSSTERFCKWICDLYSNVDLHSYAATGIAEQRPSSAKRRAARSNHAAVQTRVPAVISYFRSYNEMVQYVYATINATKRGFFVSFFPPFVRSHPRGKQIPNPKFTHVLILPEPDPAHTRARFNFLGHCVRVINDGDANDARARVSYTSGSVTNSPRVTGQRSRGNNKTVHRHGGRLMMTRDAGRSLPLLVSPIIAVRSPRRCEISGTAIYNNNSTMAEYYNEREY